MFLTKGKIRLYMAIALFLMAVIMAYSFMVSVKLCKFINTSIQLQKEVQELRSENEGLKRVLKELNGKVDTFIQMPPREAYPVIRGGSRVREILTDCQVTYYNDNGLTATGTTATPGRTIAVDPDTIPLGSRLYIELPNGETHQGIAEDTGSAVLGKVLDIHKDAPDVDLLKMGRVHGARAYILY